MVLLNVLHECWQQRAVIHCCHGCSCESRSGEEALRVCSAPDESLLRAQLAEMVSPVVCWCLQWER